VGGEKEWPHQYVRYDGREETGIDSPEKYVDEIVLDNVKVANN